VCGQSVVLQSSQCHKKREEENSIYSGELKNWGKFSHDRHFISKSLRMKEVNYIFMFVISLGTTCFVNAGLQLLFSYRPLIEDLKLLREAISEIRKPLGDIGNTSANPDSPFQDMQNFLNVFLHVFDKRRTGPREDAYAEVKKFFYTLESAVIETKSARVVTIHKEDISFNPCRCLRSTTISKSKRTQVNL